MSGSDALSWTGVFLGFSSIALAIFFYVFELKGKLDKLLEAQRVELASFRKEHSEKLERLIKDNEGILTKPQAVNLMTLYLSAVSHQLNQALGRYAENDFPAHYASRNAQLIMFQLNKLYSSVVRQSLRPLLSHFLIRGGAKFDEIVTDIGSRVVSEAFQNLAVQLEKAMESNAPPEAFVGHVQKTVFEVTARNSQEVVQLLARVYHSEA